MKPKPDAPKSNPKSLNQPELVFDRSNYLLVVLALLFIMLGFIMMSGGGSEDPNVFDRSIFSFRRITLAPILALTGYIIGVYAIMKKPVSGKQAD